jgi:hypothetical protein
MHFSQHDLLTVQIRRFPDLKLHVIISKWIAKHLPVGSNNRDISKRILGQFLINDINRADRTKKWCPEPNIAIYPPYDKIPKTTKDGPFSFIEDLDLVSFFSKFSIKKPFSDQQILRYRQKVRGPWLPIPRHLIPHGITGAKAF